MEGWQLALLAIPAGVFVLSVVMVIRKAMEIRAIKRGASQPDDIAADSTDEDPRRAKDAPPVLTDEDPRRAK